MLPAMNPSEPKQIENDSRYPVVEPLPNGNKSPRRTCEVLSRTFVWVADGSTLEQVGLRATVVLYYVRSDLIGGQPRRNRPASGLHSASCRTSRGRLPLHPRLGMNTAIGSIETERLRRDLRPLYEWLVSLFDDAGNTARTERRSG